LPLGFIPFQIHALYMHIIYALFKGVQHA
jgi:hypothetical protein